MINKTQKLNYEDEDNKILATEVKNQLFKIEESLANYIKDNITLNGDINDIFPFASEVFYEMAEENGFPYADLFILLLITINKEKFVRDMDAVKFASQKILFQSTKYFSENSTH